MHYSSKRYGYIHFLFAVVGWMIAHSILAQKVQMIREIPVLCYHQVRPHKASDGKEARAYTVTPELFAAHMRMLHDSGYQTILPAQLYEHYTNGTPLPHRPVVITFDDNTLSQFTHALPVLNKYGYKAVFFVMTVAIGKPGYMSAAQLKQLHTEGHTIGCHTWDHPDLRKLPADQWAKQLDAPLKTLSNITGKPVVDFAYPFGAWNENVILALKQRGIHMAFILSTAGNKNYPMLTHRRLMVVHPWSAANLYREMKRLFGDR
ncbi:MAG: polysaccharide deacetylase family protein [Chitinophagaceae bacterium]|nr:polysaccharide deacetylase family protein [Chitinophagaceae bacterium]